ncbi:Dephospho-CoA kinase cab5 [Rhizina undulata]
MLLIGLTGSIATGKSTVSKILASPPHSLPIVDADVLAREVVEPGTEGYRRIVEYFGPTTPNLLLPVQEGESLGRLNRTVLGRRVFGDDEERRRDRMVLNGIIHPLVRREMYKAIFKYYIHGHWAIVLDIPLLFESSLDLLCGTVLVVSVSSREIQIARLLARDKALGGDMTREDAEKRIGSQMGIEEKGEICESVYSTNGTRGRGFVVNNDGSVEDLEREVAKVMERVRKGRVGWWRYLLWAVPPFAAVVGTFVIVGNWWRRRLYLKEKARVKAKL